MSDIERRLREGRPPMAQPGPGTEARLLRSLTGARPHRSAEGWRRGLPRTRGGRLTGVALLILGGATAAALAAHAFNDSSPRGAASVAVTPPEWGPLSVLDGGLARVPRPEVAMDAAGDALVAWSPGASVRVAYRPRGGAWTTPARLSPVGTPTGDPALAMARDGRSAIVVWRERRGAQAERRVLRLPDASLAGVIRRTTGGDYVLVARRWVAGSGWAAPVDLSEIGRNGRDMARPQAVPSGSGFLVAWARDDGLETRAVSAAGGLGPVSSVRSSGTGVPFAPYLAGAGPAHAALTWATMADQSGTAGPEGPTYGVQVARLGPSGWSTPVTVASGVLQDPHPVVAVEPTGDAAVAWAGFADRRTRVVASRAMGGGDWEPAVPLSAAGRSAFGPNIAIDGSGTIVAHWSVGGGTQFAAARIRGPWTKAEGAGSAGLVSQLGSTLPFLASDGAGRLIGAFGRRAGASVRDWPEGGPFGAPQSAIAGTGWEYGIAGLAASSSGSAALVSVGLGPSGRWGKGWSVGVAIRERPSPSDRQDGR